MCDDIDDHVGQAATAQVEQVASSEVVDKDKISWSSLLGALFKQRAILPTMIDDLRSATRRQSHTSNFGHNSHKSAAATPPHVKVCERESSSSSPTNEPVPTSVLSFETICTERYHALHLPTVSAPSSS